MKQNVTLRNQIELQSIKQSEKNEGIKSMFVFTDPLLQSLFQVHI